MRVAVIGVGHVGTQHARLWAAQPGTTLAAVCDIDAERAGAVAAAHGARGVANYIDALAGVDAVSIATPTATHREIAMECLRRGIPALVEKPLAKTVADAEALVRESDARGVPLAVGHVERFNPVVEATRDWIARPRFIECHRLSAFPRRSADINVVLDLMIHDIDLLLHLVPSAIKRVDAVGVSMLFPHEDIAHARLEFEDGCVANVTASRISAQPMRKVRVFAEGLYLSMDLLKHEIAAYRPTEELAEAIARLPKTEDPSREVLASLPERFYDVKFHQFPEGEPLAAELADFRRAVEGGRPPAVPAEHGLRAMRVADDVTRAIRSHRWER